jgi:serine protease
MEYTSIVQVENMGMDGPGNTLQTAQKLSVITQLSNINDTVSTVDGDDFYQFNLGGRSSFNLALDGLSADADVQLIQDINSNGQVDENEVLASSIRSGRNAESINTELDAGGYYIRVYAYDTGTINYSLSALATPIDYAGNSLDAGRNITIDASERIYTDWVGSADSNDYYRFQLNTTSNLKLTLNGMSSDADVQLLSGSGGLIASSTNVGNINESISRTLQQGTYYVRVSPYSGETFYNLTLSTTPSGSTQKDSTASSVPITTDAGNPPLIANASVSPLPIGTSAPPPQSPITRTVAGTLRADTFTYETGYNLSVFSGNGNVDFGTGARDILDLSQFASTGVNINYANTATGGVIYNLGNGNRLFDAIKLTDGSDIYFEGIEAIKFADTVMNLAVTPNDPMFNQQSNLHMMGVQNAWRFTTGSSNVLIGAEDTGIATNSQGLHPDLRNTIFFGDNYQDEEPTVSHGTSVLGAIGAAGNNGIGIAGINWNSDLAMVDVVGGNPGDYDLATATQLLINQANSKGQRLVVNLSLSGGYSAAFEQLIANNQNNALFTIASGNGDSNTIASPADLAKKYSNTIAVGAVWATKDWYGNPKTPGDRTTYLNWWGSNYGEGLTLVAPNEFITTSATRANSSSPFAFAYNDKFNGTSASTTEVSGVASLVWSVNPNLTAGQVKDILASTAYDLGTPGYDQVYGSGFVNADAAVRRAIALARGVA